MTTISQAQPLANGRRQLVIAGVLGLVAAVLAVVFLSSAAGNGDAPASAPMSSVVVAGGAIAAGEPITEAKLTTNQVPASAIASGAYVDKQLVIGQVARYPIAQGEQLTPVRLVEAPTFKSLSFQIPPGLRGMTIPVTETSSPAALIAPGDFVDVLISVEQVVITGRAQPEGQEDQKGAATILQNAQVLTVERNHVETGVVYDPSVRGEPAAEKEKVTFVTLAVTPEQAQVLWLAQDKGKITVILRPFGEAEIQNVSPVIGQITP